MRLLPRLTASLAPMLLVAACTGSPASPSPSPSSSPTPPASEAASPIPGTPSQDAGSEGVVVTIRTEGDEEYRILLTDPEDIAVAERLLSGEEETARIPNGLIVRDGDGGVNTGYSWHIDPESLEFAELTTEVCDGRPSYVEDGTLTGEWFCPWSAEVVAIEPAG